MERDHLPTDHALSRRDEHLSRRALLVGAAAATACATAPSPTRPVHTGSARTRPRVVVVGAGLAGLVAAYRLKQREVDVTLYEAQRRVGGRAFTLREYFPVKCELGGELVDTRHAALRALLTELDLPLVDLAAATTSLERERYVLGGQRYTERQLLELMRPVVALMLRDLRALGNTAPNWEHHSPAAAALDALSTSQWLERNGVRGPLRSLFDAAFTSELGRDLSEQSALTFLYAVGKDLDRLSLFGASDERFMVRDGSDAPALALAQRLGSRLKTEHALTALRARDDGGVALTFERGGGAVDVHADRVILALPFTQLRRCAIGVELPREKRRVIEELPYGTNAKVMVSMRERVWAREGSSGTSFNDGGVYHESWDSTRGVESPVSILTAFTGGALGRAVGESNPEAQGRRFVDALDAVWPGASDAYTGRAARMHWPTARHFEGSYACYAPGDWCRLSGAEAPAVGALHFAGEHTSAVSPGYMDGAVESGERAAREVLAAVSARRSPPT